MVHRALVFIAAIILLAEPVAAGGFVAPPIFIPSPVRPPMIFSPPMIIPSRPTSPTIDPMARLAEEIRRWRIAQADGDNKGQFGVWLLVLCDTFWDGKNCLEKTSAMLYVTEAQCRQMQKLYPPVFRRQHGDRAVLCVSPDGSMVLPDLAPGDKFSVWAERPSK